MRALDHEPLFEQPAQRLSYRRAAHPELARQSRLDQPLPHGEVSGRDRVADRVVGEVRELLARDRRHPPPRARLPGVACRQRCRCHHVTRAHHAHRIGACILPTVDDYLTLDAPPVRRLSPIARRSLRECSAGNRPVRPAHRGGVVSASAGRSRRSTRRRARPGPRSRRPTPADVDPAVRRDRAPSTARPGDRSPPLAAGV